MLDPRDGDANVSRATLPLCLPIAHMRLLLIAFIVVPLVELYLLLWVAQWVGFWPTLALTIVTGLIGGGLAKREGLKVIRQWQAALHELRPPPTGLLQGALILVGGAFLLTPGILTDVAGVCLLLPVTRTPIANLLRKRVDRYIAVRTTSLHTSPFAGVNENGVGSPRDARGPRDPSVIDTTGQSND